jgi:hypothetical protein
LALLALATTAVSSAGRGSKPIEATADRMLREMADYLAGLKSFTVKSSAVDEIVLASGQKVQLASESLVSVQRPNRLRSEQLGAESGLAFWYDGKNMTLACKPSNSYATAPAPQTIDATIDRVRKEFHIDAPGADLLFSRPYDILTEQVTGGRFIGRETVDGVPVNHLAFEGEQVDWQIWIKEGKEPLPLRFVITTKGMKGQPQFTVRLTEWEPRANIMASVFQFPGAPRAKRVEQFPVACRPGLAN